MYANLIYHCSRTVGNIMFHNMYTCCDLQQDFNIVCNKNRQLLLVEKSRRVQLCRSRIHEGTISLRFLGIILRVLRLKVSAWSSETAGKRVWFSIRFSSFLYSVQQLNCRNCKRLREFEEIKSSRQSCRGDCKQQGGKLLRLL